MTRFSKTSRCRATGFLVSVEHAEDAGLDAGDGVRWYTTCEEHSTLCGHSTLKLAKHHASWPEWCEDCRPLLVGEN